MNGNRMFFEKGPSPVCLLAKRDINLSLKILTVPQAEHHRDYQRTGLIQGRTRQSHQPGSGLGRFCSSQEVASVLLITPSKGNGKMTANELSFFSSSRCFLAENWSFEFITLGPGKIGPIKPSWASTFYYQVMTRGAFASGSGLCGIGWRYQDGMLECSGITGPRQLIIGWHLVIYKRFLYLSSHWLLAVFSRKRQGSSESWDLSCITHSTA